MRIDGSNYSIAELREMLHRKDLIVNRDYQRGARLWPAGPRSYFIDTILTNFPFPKLYFYEYLDRNNKKTRREIVDGQQRITAIMDFIEDKYALTDVSRQYRGAKFSQLEPEVQEGFLSYSVPVDVIRNAEKADILEMFRRMNAYTLPLNEAEKRHSSFQGPFKWFINECVSEFTPLFIEYAIFTKRQMVRMADAELLSEMIMALEEGIISSSNRVLSNLYKKYDAEFSPQDDYYSKIREFFEFMSNDLGVLRKTYLMKPYVIHSLFCAAMQNKYGIPHAGSKIELDPTGCIIGNKEKAVESLQTLALAHEEKDLEGDFGEGFYPVFTDGLIKAENSRSRRATLRRIRGLCNRSR